MIRLLVLAATVALALPAAAQPVSGSLATSDPTLDTGEYIDRFQVQARRGQTVRAVLTSSDFDTYVMLRDAAGVQEDNDDCTTGETERSCVDLVVSQTGTVRVLVTSYAPGETGGYQLTVTVGGRAVRLTPIAAEAVGSP